MAESFVFNVAEKVLGKLGPLALEEVLLAWGVEKELKKLESTLSGVHAVLLDAEEQQTKNRQLTDWLGKIKEVLYDVDDVLDEFQYEALRSQVVNREGIKRKVRDFFSRRNPLAFRFHMGHKIKEIRETLNEIAAEKAKFHLREQLVDRRVVHGEREMTDSFVRASDVIGRDDDKENIVKLLMGPGEGENVSVIPIVGIGGLGKTTLAKLVYNDERIVNHFELKMWVCVSDDFDVIKLTKEIIKSTASGENCNDFTIDKLQNCLRRNLDNKIFLLVLDDVWNQDQGKWMKLKRLLLGGAKGSKIIVTTRSRSVASIMSTIPAYILKGLPHEHCLSLFVKWAFREGEEKQYLDLMKIGDDIVKKCGGVPLAVRTLGSLLYLKTDKHDWLFIKDNEIWKFEQKEDDILPALRLSYDAMPSYLKQCFSYCSIFPKDHIIWSWELIPMWIAQGLIQPSNENQELEEIGQQYFKELWSRSFFQDVKEYTLFFAFKMHDLVHDLALSVSQSECLIVNYPLQNISKTVRHVSFSDINLVKDGVPRSMLELDNLRTILIPDLGAGPSDISFVETCIARFKYLRMLDLSYSSFEVLPTSIGNLKHLRCLYLFGNVNIKKLPNSICKLQSLQTLELFSCTELEELPKDIGNLICLRSLSLTTKQEILPEEGIGRLNSLRNLEILDCSNLKYLGEGMKRLTALRTLFIRDCGSLEESLSRTMRHLTTLETLHICNCEKLNLMDSEEDCQDLTPSLRSLEIYGFPQLVALPQWIQGAATTLQLLRIINCPHLAALPEWLQNLTSLRKLAITRCPKLWGFPEGMRRLTALRELEIEQCPKLMRRCKRDTGKDWPKIAHIPEKILDEKTSDEFRLEEEGESSDSVAC